ncbi:sigma-70 family RNA polymerase sigma factor [Enterococcus sp. 669A]|uniref:Sigma-70 family RNA polymerase sigma factor n=1 Tax=Candidatus Enterococcus moelleringii TaxID=2815325 RepID=A0ABS3LDY5_9ENTE|nr:sigma-70 family RNA polymerase sigma factor [Enterococcus sp. 669A]MBO1307248.1 sigma-70 family RNA polymerase sigma factor [Enterococcus sp. 669A]
MTDEEVRKRIIAGDEQFFDQLMDQYSKLLWAVAATILTAKNSSQQMDIEEVVSDVFLRLWQQPEKYKPSKGSIKSYLVVMTKSMALNKLKSKQRHQHENISEISEEYLSNIPKAEEEIAWQELYDAVMLLEEPTRRILILRFFYEMKPSEIQSQLGLSSKEVDNRLYRGKKKLQEFLEYRKFINEVNTYE